METIETIFENYKAGYNEETPQTEEQAAGLAEFSGILGHLFSNDSQEEYRIMQQIFNSAVSYARASEKSGFVLGFKMAVNIMNECRQ